MTRKRPWAAAFAAAVAALAYGPAGAMDRVVPAVNFAPDPSDPGYYDSVQGVQFARHVACQLSSNPAAPHEWPVPAKDRLGSGSGSGMRIGSDADFNRLVTTIMLSPPTDNLPPGAVLVCRGSIMANGRDVTRYPADASDILLVPYANLWASGWPTVSPKLDPAKLAAVRSASPDLRVHSEGMISLKPGDKVDFDTDAEQKTGPGDADLWFEGAYFTPVNGAQIGQSFLGSSDCSQAKYSAKRFAYSPASVPPDSYICMKTNEGHSTVFRISGAEGGVLSIGYTTFE